MILERDAELALLRRALADIPTDGGKVILIRGEAGIGKSALVAEFLAEAVDRAHTLVGGCDDLLITQPLGPLWDMARHETSLREPLEEGNRPGILDVALDLLSRSLRPSIIVVEDTQWGDDATLDVIRYVGRRIAGTNGLLILTYRDGEVDHDHPLRGVIGDLPPSSMIRIRLEGLSREAVASMIAESDLDPDAVMRATRGNPFLVVEVASAAGDEELPTSLEAAVMGRVGKLTIGSQELLKTLAVVPEPIPLADALALVGADEDRFAESERRGLIQVNDGLVAFHHELIRRTIESTLTASERLAKNRQVLGALPEETHLSLLIHCAVEADDVERLIDLAPRSARYAAATGSHLQAAEDFRTLEPHLDRLDPDDRGALLVEWAHEELLVDNVAAALELADMAAQLYAEQEDTIRRSEALARAAHYAENSGDRAAAEERAHRAVEALGDDPDGQALAVALEVNAYLAMMAGDVDAIPGLVQRTLAAAGANPDPRILVRSLNHRGIGENIANYPAGRASLDEAWRRAADTGQWYELCRAQFNQGWAAVEFRDLPVASEYLQRAIKNAARHEMPSLESYGTALYARALCYRGEWGTAEDLATDALEGMPLSQMVALPVVGVIAARTGRSAAGNLLRRGWDMAVRSGENQRKAPAAACLAEFAWISGDDAIPRDAFVDVIEEELAKGFRWSPGAIAFWLWKQGLLDRIPPAAAEPYRLMAEGKATEAAAAWENRGIPYEAAIALMHGSDQERLEALRRLEGLGATAVAARLRQDLRTDGVAVPRGRARATRDHSAGLTARQAEVLDLLAEGLSNPEIADRLFVSPRTVENHVSAVLMKLDVADRAQAVKVAEERGLISA